MLFFILVCIYHKSKSKDPLKECTNFFKKKMPMDGRSNDAKQIKEKMKEAFGVKKFKYSEKGDIIKNNKNEFANIGSHIIKKWKLENSKKITNCTINRCMERNLPFFVYAVLEMKEVFPDDFENVKRYYLQKKVIDDITDNTSEDWY